MLHFGPSRSVKESLLSVGRRLNIITLVVVGVMEWGVFTQRRYAEEIENRFINASGWLGDRRIRDMWRQTLDVVVKIHLRLQTKVQIIGDLREDDDNAE